MRPDDERFSQFTRHLTQLDPKLDAFAQSAGFRLEINPFHRPCRYLRKEDGNPSWLIVLLLDRDWHTAEIGIDMEHTVRAISDYVPPEDPASVWRRDQIIADSIPFSQLLSRVDDVLATALRLLTAWSPESIMRDGTRSENLWYKNRDELRKLAIIPPEELYRLGETDGGTS